MAIHVVSSFFSPLITDDPFKLLNHSSTQKGLVEGKIHRLLGISPHWKACEAFYNIPVWRAQIWPCKKLMAEAALTPTELTFNLLDHLALWEACQRHKLLMSRWEASSCGCASRSMLKCMCACYKVHLLGNWVYVHIHKYILVKRTIQFEKCTLRCVLSISWNIIFFLRGKMPHWIRWIEKLKSQNYIRLFFFFKQYWPFQRMSSVSYIIAFLPLI